MMAVTKVCCTCLSFDVQMFSLTNNDIRECLEKFINIKMELEDETLQNICEECVFSISKFVKFKDKCLKANQRLTQLVSQYTHISEDILKAESLKLHSEPTIEFKEDPDSNYVQQPISFKSEINIDCENTSESFESETDLNVDRLEDDTKIEINSDHDNLECEDISSSANPELEKSYKVECEREDVKSPEKKNVRGSPKKNNLLVKKKRSSWESEYVVKITLTKKQQMQESLKMENFDGYLNSPFKCTHCVTGFPTESQFEQHMELHKESRGAWQCDICKLRYCNLRRLQLHQTSHEVRYKCLKCGYLMQTKWKAMTHLSRHKISVSYDCKICDEKFNYHLMYRRHIHTAHPTDYVCDLCGDYFTSQGRLDRHKKSTTGCRKWSKNIFECKMCDSRFLTLISWYRHMLTHAKAEEQIAPTECQICGHETKTWNDWSHHIVYKHPHKKKVDTKLNVDKKNAMRCTCDICGKTLSSKVWLSAHINSQHTDKPLAPSYSSMKWKDPCEVCNKNITRGNMRRHLLTHTGVKPYKCHLCEKSYTSPHNKDTHLRNKHNIVNTTVDNPQKKYSYRISLNKKDVKTKKPAYDFSCSICFGRYKSKHNLAMHEMTHTGQKPYTCDICQRTYNNKYYLEVHRNIHTGEKPYACNDCDLRFTNKSYLRQHVQKHAGEILFACHICNRTFTLKKNLQRHEAVHTGVKNYTCDLCGKMFTYTASLNLHIKTVHLHLPHPPRKPRKRKIRE